MSDKERMRKKIVKINKHKKKKKDHKKKSLKKKSGGGSHRGAKETNLTRSQEVVGSIPGLAQWVRDLVLP